MPPLTDPQVLQCYKNALGNWRYEGFIVFNEQAERGLRQVLEGFTQRLLKELLHEFVCIQNGEVDAVVETREQWAALWSHHYDLRPVINGVCIYIETRLRSANPADPDDPILYIVNIHRA